ncbi:glutathione peroxidase [Anaerocolumna cellulosilytica]|uniref:Glutathione peroxidase n=1 Tax=Anaerocolumna cellulosilytica TaxID=433286 RepID=A0A6S6QZP2_9FIRM|nr:glutathione peroxidase [Anaerocolumna cellulosilytica]MBB5194268.1 glutathione peroxidase [Anaerocolumna cellulosilytica]BCJ94519.1 glutathione peroxidase [Anaerocolumna cellulosilytica]
MGFYDYSAVKMDGKEVRMEQYKGKVVIVVNTASKCGLTPQFKELEELYKKYKDQGLVILGFPCNQFAKQDPAGNDEINSFCQLNYGVSFDMFQKIDVNGSEAHPLYQYLKSAAKGALGNTIKWNFTKFLIDKDGNVIERFAPTVNPVKMEDKITELL